MTKYDKDKLLQSIQFAYIAAGVVILALTAAVFSTAWFTYELRIENDSLRRELEAIGKPSDVEEAQVRFIDESERIYQRTDKRFGNSGERPFRRRNA